MNFLLYHEKIKQKKLVSCLNFKRQKGAGMIFFAFLIPIMMIMIVLIADVGQLVYEKIRLQQTVDEATLSAANIQAIGLNEIADLNRAAYEEYVQAVDIMSTYTWFDALTADSVMRYFEQVFSWLDYYRMDANQRFAELAHEYAAATVEANLPEAVSSGLIDFDMVSGASNEHLMHYVKEFLPITYRYYTSFCNPPTCTSDSAFWFNPAPADRAYPRKGGAHIVPTPRIIPAKGVYTPSVRWIKMTPPVTYASYELKQKEKRFLLGKNMFSDIFPELKVYASAKPTQGDIFNMSPFYIPALNHLQRQAPLPGIDNLELIDH